MGVIPTYQGNFIPVVQYQPWATSVTFHDTSQSNTGILNNSWKLVTLLNNSNIS